jgi:hypothetical protein
LGRQLRFLCLLGAAVLVVGVSVPVRAQSDDEPPLRQTAVFYEFGLGTPIGFQGLEAVRRIGSYGEGAVGLGMGTEFRTQVTRTIKTSNGLRWGGF